MSAQERGQQFLAALRSQGYGGDVGLLICDVEGEVLASLNSAVSFPAASTIKVPLLLHALEEVQAGQLQFTERHTLLAGQQVSGAGVLHHLAPGLALTLHDLLTLMIAVSDNTATNMVIDLLGLDAFNAWLALRGYAGTRLVGKLQVLPELRNAAQRRGERNATTAADQVRALMDLQRGRYLEAASQALALDMLNRQQHRTLLARHLPRDEHGASLYQSFTKSGELSGVHHDVGRLALPRPLIVALLTQGGHDPREHPENRDVLVISATLFPLLAVLGGLHGDI